MRCGSASLLGRTYQCQLPLLFGLKKLLSNPFQYGQQPAVCHLRMVHELFDSFMMAQRAQISFKSTDIFDVAAEIDFDNYLHQLESLLLECMHAPPHSDGFSCSSLVRMVLRKERIFSYPPNVFNDVKPWRVYNLSVVMCIHILYTDTTFLIIRNASYVCI